MTPLWFSFGSAVLLELLLKQHCHSFVQICEVHLGNRKTLQLISTDFGKPNITCEMPSLFENSSPEPQWISKLSRVCWFYISPEATMASAMVTDGKLLLPVCFVIIHLPKKRSCVFSFCVGKKVLDDFQFCQPCRTDHDSSGLWLNCHWQHKVIKQVGAKKACGFKCEKPKTRLFKRIFTITGCVFTDNSHKTSNKNSINSSFKQAMCAHLKRNIKQLTTV